MSAIVIDTNVLLVADGKAAQMSPACRAECAQRLEAVKAGECVVLDQGRLILREYQKKLDPSGKPPTPGNLFLKWLMTVWRNERHVSQVPITPINAEQTDFAEFSSDPALVTAFDPANRKFVAVANAHPEKRPIVESADSKWLGWEADLKRHGIQLEILCRRELEAIRARKTGTKP
jgi:hypothetical protein